MNKRDLTTDNEILDALDACDGHVGRAALCIGVTTNTLSRWILDSDSLKAHAAHRREQDGMRARDKLNEILDDLDHRIPEFTGHVIRVCRTLLDKSEADKMDIKQTTVNKLDRETEKKIDAMLDKIEE